MRNFVSEEINVNRTSFSYVSLLQFAFTIEKQIYELNQENRVIADEYKQSLLSGYDEVDIVTFTCHLKIAFFKDSKASKGDRAYLMHAPQAIMDLDEAYKLVLKLLQNQDVESIKKVLNILKIYSPFPSPYAGDIEILLNAISHLPIKNEMNKGSINFFLNEKKVLQTNVDDAATLARLASNLIYSQVKWFVNRVFKLNSLGKDYKKNLTHRYENPSDNAVNDALMDIMNEVSRHMLNSATQVFHDQSLQQMTQMSNEPFLNTLFLIS